MQKLVGVDAGAQGDGATVPQRLPLSICAVTRGSSTRLTTLLARLHPLAEEIVVALDERAEIEAPALTAVADKVVLFSHRDPGDSIIPWLHQQCGSSWIFNLDDDEVPSRELLLHLPELLAADVTHWWLPRRWLVGSVEAFLDEPPWVPDYQLRLYRREPATLRFSDQFHRPVVAAGPAGFARHPLWHLDCLLNTFECRRDKALMYERARRGMRVAGLAHNSAFYLPELRPEAKTGRVPEADAQVIRDLLRDAPPTRRLRRGALRRADRAEIDGAWPGEPYDPELYAATITPLERLNALPERARHTIGVALANRSRSTWRYGPDAAPAIFVGTRWFDLEGELVEEGIHTPLPADVPGGSSLDVPVHVLAPSRPGRYRLSIDLVHEHVRWFGQGIELTVEITPPPRVALIGAGEPLERALDRIHLEPEVEPLIVGRHAPEGIPKVPGLGAYLLAGIEGAIGPLELARLVARTVKLRRRARRLGRGKPSAPLPGGAEECLLGLRACERLLVVGPDWQRDAAVTRQLWRLAATTRTARMLGLTVEGDLPGFVPTGLLDRLLTRLIRRSWLARA